MATTQQILTEVASYLSQAGWQLVTVDQVHRTRWKYPAFNRFYTIYGALECQVECVELYQEEVESEENVADTVLQQAISDAGVPTDQQIEDAAIEQQIADTTDTVEQSSDTSGDEL